MIAGASIWTQCGRRELKIRGCTVSFLSMEKPFKVWLCVLKAGSRTGCLDSSSRFHLVFNTSGKHYFFTTHLFIHISEEPKDFSNSYYKTDRCCSNRLLANSFVPLMSPDEKAHLMIIYNHITPKNTRHCLFLHMHTSTSATAVWTTHNIWNINLWWK